MAARNVPFIVLSGFLLTSCALFDSGIPWRSGNFAMMWIDLPDEVSLCYDRGSGSWSTLIEPRVFAVGSDGDYVVAQQHPHGDKTITQYFIIDVHRFDPRTLDGVVGPLTAAEFATRSTRLQLPPFSTVLESLR